MYMPDFEPCISTAERLFLKSSHGTPSHKTLVRTHIVSVNFKSSHDVRFEVPKKNHIVFLAALSHVRVLHKFRFNLVEVPPFKQRQRHSSISLDSMHAHHAPGLGQGCKAPLSCHAFRSPPFPVKQTIPNSWSLDLLMALDTTEWAALAHACCNHVPIAKTAPSVASPCRR